MTQIHESDTTARRARRRLVAAMLDTEDKAEELRISADIGYGDALEDMMYDLYPPCEDAFTVDAVTGRLTLRTPGGGG